MVSWTRVNSYVLQLSHAQYLDALWHFLCLQCGLGYCLLEKGYTKEEYSASTFTFRKDSRMVDVQ
jgi:hypothetical protein